MKDREAVKKRVRQWDEADKMLTQLKRLELQNVDIEKTILCLEDAFQLAMRNQRASRLSGVMEMQRWFGKFRP